MKKLFSFIFALSIISVLIYIILVISDKMYYNVGHIQFVAYELTKEILKIIGKTIVFSITFAIIMNSMFAKYINRVKK